MNKNPNDFDSLVKLGNLFYDGKEFPGAIQYYERALAIHPDNPDVRTDMGTAYWYTGNAEKAMAAMETSLKYRPGHPQTLFNLGWVRWQGKQDPKGAIRGLAAIAQGESRLSAAATGGAVHRQGERARRAGIETISRNRRSFINTHTGATGLPKRKPLCFCVDAFVID